MVYLPISPTVTTGNVSLWMLELFEIFARRKRKILGELQLVYSSPGTHISSAVGLGMHFQFEI